MPGVSDCICNTCGRSVQRFPSSHPSFPTGFQRAGNTGHGRIGSVTAQAPAELVQPTDEIETGISAERIGRGTASSATANTSGSRRSTTRIRTAARIRTGERSERGTLAHDTNRSHEPADPMCVHWGWRGAPPPRPPDGDTAVPRRCRAGAASASVRPPPEPRAGGFVDAGRSRPSGSAQSARARRRGRFPGRLRLGNRLGRTVAAVDRHPESRAAGIESSTMRCARSVGALVSAIGENGRPTNADGCERLLGGAGSAGGR